MPLSSQQVRKLRGYAHSLKVIVTVGNNGLTESVQNEIDNALEQHELLKIRVNAGDRDERNEMIKSICEKSGATLIQRIGHVASLYRTNPEMPKVDPGKA
ncbi:MAG: YhbY family RNA-binding protein [Sulfuriflexus sp.]|nr:YhbY family RNA-binding protein [Sulfuriflexus sp.]